MSETNKNRILTEFKELYDSLQFNMIECGDGWFDLVYTLSSDIMNLCDKNNAGEYPRVVQVKEKFGGLRYYISNVKNIEIAAKIDSLIDAACTRSYKICEQCGRPGYDDTTMSWQRTLCKACWSSYKDSR